MINVFVLSSFYQQENLKVSLLSQQLNLDDTDPYTQSTFRELFTQAVKAMIPTYPVAVIKSKDSNNKDFFQFVDGLSFFKSMTDDAGKKKDFIKTIFNTTIHRSDRPKHIHFVGMNCFRLNQKEEITDKEIPTSFSSLPSEKFKVEIQSKTTGKVDNLSLEDLVFVGLDYMHLNEKNPQKDKVGKAQDLVGQIIQNKMEKESRLWFKSASLNGIK